MEQIRHTKLRIVLLDPAAKTNKSFKFSATFLSHGRVKYGLKPALGFKLLLAVFERLTF